MAERRWPSHKSTKVDTYSAILVHMWKKRSGIPRRGVELVLQLLDQSRQFLFTREALLLELSNKQFCSREFSFPILLKSQMLTWTAVNGNEYTKIRLGLACRRRPACGSLVLRAAAL